MGSRGRAKEDRPQTFRVLAGSASSDRSQTRHFESDVNDGSSEQASAASRRSDGRQLALRHVGRGRCRRQAVVPATPFAGVCNDVERIETGR
jgi:hypothetical protein